MTDPDGTRPTRRDKGMTDESLTPVVSPASPSHYETSREIARLRDRVISLTGLTKQDVAQAIGVSRRSLYGFATGEIRPTDGRIVALRVLADTAEWSVRHFGAHARRFLRGPDSESSPLKLIAEGRTDIRSELLDAAARDGWSGAVQVSARHRETTKEPLYIKAASEWSGKGSLPTRRGVPRDEAVYEQDLSKAAATAPEALRPRRRRI